MFLLRPGAIKHYFRPHLSHQAYITYKWFSFPRLMSELQGWILGHREERQQQQQQKRRKTYPTPRRMKAALKYPRAAADHVDLSPQYAGPQQR